MEGRGGWGGGGRGGVGVVGLPPSVMQCFVAFAIMVFSAQFMLVNRWIPMKCVLMCLHV